MKALSLWQPWATLITRGDKVIETRSWSTLYRGPIAIHAAKTKANICHWTALWKHATPGQPTPDAPSFPLGCIVAVAVLAAIAPTHEIKEKITIKECAFGDYTIGRFAWVLDKVKPLIEPVACRGYQALWDLDETIVQDVMRRVKV